MTKEQIQKAYEVAEKYFDNHKDYRLYNHELMKDFVNIGIQMALQGEVIFDSEGALQRID